LRVIEFLEAYEWIKESDKMKKYVHSQFLKSNDYNDNAMEELNNVFRNQFIHYKPICWGIEIQKIKEVVEGVLPILRFLISDSGNISWHNNTPQDAAQILDEIHKHLLPKRIP